ncbi:MAG: hypothetical protein IPN58_15795 [Anaerolineales bacterium]|nr:hypothetical protein [Anaerolineales bacterium]
MDGGNRVWEENITSAAIFVLSVPSISEYWGLCYGIFLYLGRLVFGIVSGHVFKSTNLWMERNYKAFSIYVLMSLFSLLLSLFIYQATSTVGFGLLVAYLMRPKDDWQKIFRTGLYYGFFGVTAVLYLFLNKIIWAAYHMPATSRTQMISSFSDIIQKISWFVTYVFPQSARQVIFIFSGKFLFTQEWSLITLVYQNPSIGLLVESTMLGVVILGYFYRIKKSNLPLIKTIFSIILCQYYCLLCLFPTLIFSC